MPFRGKNRIGYRALLYEHDVSVGCGRPCEARWKITAQSFSAGLSGITGLSPFRDDMKFFGNISGRE
jgi:hypothetical protein